ncbi:Hexosyltransferase [Forsythia ovata]|uniref:Hexosyltransferase n=1 Tax=Forsythia ovata TaxID=205694 RepID=A0ABD1RPY6_9LAMI
MVLKRWTRMPMGLISWVDRDGNLGEMGGVVWELEDEWSVKTDLKKSMARQPLVAELARQPFWLLVESLDNQVVELLGNHPGCRVSSTTIYFRHASGEIFAISQALAQFISMNRLFLHMYSHDDVSAGSWFIGLDVKHVDEGKFCCSSWSSAPVKLLDKLMHEMPQSSEEQIVVVFQEVN